MDTAAYGGASVLPRPWFPGGGFKWRIPALWKVGDGPTNALGWSDQVFRLEADGTMTVQKFGHSVTRHVDENYGKVDEN